MNVYELVTNKILELLGQGVNPWKRQWDTGLPQNYHTKRPYNGYNLLYLSIMQQLKRWTTPYYLTYRGAQEHGWHVRKGENGNMVIFWKLDQKTIVQDDGNEEMKPYRVLRYYWVFNLDQIEGLPDEERAKLRNDNKPIMSCEELINSFVPGLPQILNGAPAYSPKTDTIYLPLIEQFDSSESYYATRYHETVHATGAAHRLNRPGVVEAVNFGSERYSFEELIAELGAAFLAAMTGISNATIENDAAYIQNWLDVLKNEPTWIIKASSQAQRAVNYLLGKKELKK